MLFVKLLTHDFYQKQYFHLEEYITLNRNLRSFKEFDSKPRVNNYFDQIINNLSNENNLEIEVLKYISGSKL